MAKYNDLTVGQMEAAINIMGGWENFQAFLRGDLLVKAKEGVFQTWKTITLGLLKSADEYRTALHDQKFRISDWAADILQKVTVMTEKKTIELVKVSVAELGFKDGARYDAICARAKELGLELCPAEVGPALRLAYTDQPINEWFVVAMEPLRDLDGRLGVFRVARHDDGALSSDYGRPDGFWRDGSRFVFARK